jgi:hypothetical protein
VAFTDLVDYVNVVVAGYCFAVAVVAVGLAGFVAAGRAVAGCVDHPAAVVVVGYFVADLGFAGCFVDAADLDFAVAVAVVAVSVGLAVDY